MSKVQSAWERRSFASFADQATWPVMAIGRILSYALVPPRSFQVQALLQGLLVAACVAWRIWAPHQHQHAALIGFIAVIVWVTGSVTKLLQFMKNLDEREKAQCRAARETGLWCALGTALLSPLLIINDLKYPYAGFSLEDGALSFMTTFLLTGLAFHLPRLFMLGRMLQASEP